MATDAAPAQEEEYEEVDALEESDDEFVYEEVDVDEEEDDLGDDGEDLETAMRSLHGLGGTAGGAGQSKSPEPAPGEVTKRPEVRTTTRTRISPFSFFFSFPRLVNGPARPRDGVARSDVASTRACSQRGTYSPPPHV